MCENIKDKLVTYVMKEQNRFYRLAYSHVGNREAALDIVQNAIVKALENYPSIRKPEYMETWFYRILLNECYSYMRKGKREISYDPEVLWQMQEYQIEEVQESDIYEQVMKLPDKMKTVIILRFYEEFTLEEIARATNSGLSVVKYRLYTGLKHMEHGMKEEAR